MKQRDVSPWSEDEIALYLQLGYWQKMSLGAYLRQWAQRYANNIAVIAGENQLTYRQLDQKVDRLAAGFYQQGIRPGDKVLVQLPNCIGFVVSFFALFRIGALPILAMPSQRENDIDALCELAKPKSYLVPYSFLGTDYRPLIQRIADKYPQITQLHVGGENDPDLTMTPFEAEPVTLEKPHYLDIAVLLLSGGTTGTPKLIPRTHADYAYNSLTMADICGINENSVYLAALPIAHNFSLSCPGLLGILSAGGSIVLAKTAGFDEAFMLIERHKVTITALVPALVQMWLSAREWDDTDLSSLQLLQAGGARLESCHAEKVRPMLGCQLQQVFGMAEGLICCTRLDDSDDIAIHTQGRPISPHDQVNIIDGNGQSVAPGELGELLTKGPYTIHGYYQAEEQNKTSFTQDSFYCSGDLVRLTPQGNFVVEGRIKEQINRAGEKIATAEIEQLLSAHPQIESSILVAVPDPRLGERSCAYIMSRDSSLTLANVRDYLQRQGLALYKLPDQLEHIVSWPLTSVGKIDKRRLAVMATTPEIKRNETVEKVNVVPAPLRQPAQATLNQEESL